LGHYAAFSLDEIALMFASDGWPRIDRQMLRAKAEELDRTIRKLADVRDGLRHAAACRAPSHMECPTFRRILGAAGPELLDHERKRVGPHASLNAASRQCFLKRKAAKPGPLPFPRLCETRSNKAAVNRHPHGRNMSGTLETIRHCIEGEIQETNT